MFFNTNQFFESVHAKFLTKVNLFIKEPKNICPYTGSPPSRNYSLEIFLCFLYCGPNKKHKKVAHSIDMISQQILALIFGYLRCVFPTESEGPGMVSSYFEALASLGRPAGLIKKKAP